MKKNEQRKLKAKSLLKRLRPIEDWMKNDEAMAIVQRVYGDPADFYEWFRSELVALTK